MKEIIERMQTAHALNFPVFLVGDLGRRLNFEDYSIVLCIVVSTTSVIRILIVLIIFIMHINTLSIIHTCICNMNERGDRARPGDLLQDNDGAMLAMKQSMQLSLMLQLQIRIKLAVLFLAYIDGNACQ